ncbi:hypothetical protein FOZ62_011550 [Perkinsus olseni]|uniref:Myb-like domain-containing protein n=1 Tax=Perkinsus olseni TaxID=32597 RepID=A0A7J6SFG2_PEROL|nr:hypothetical protein FOZ62_011550 [Perkinsus olseni]
MGRGGRALGCQRCLGLTEHECPVVLRCHGCGFRCHPQCTYPPLRCNPRRLRHWMCEACAQERHAKSKVTMHYNYCVVCGSGGDLINKCATCRHASHADCESLHHGRCTLCARNMSVHTKRLDLYNWALIIARQKGRKVPVIQGKRIEWDSSGTKVLRQSIWATSEIVHALTEKLLVTRGGSIVRLRGRFDRAMAESACGAATDETKERPPRRVMELFEDGLPWDRWKCILRFHNDDHINKDLLSVTDLGVLVGEDILKLDASMEEEKSNVASAVGKNPRPKAKGKVRRGHSAEPQEVEVQSLDDGWTKEEIERLYKAVDNEGHITDGFWKRVAKGVGTKTARECSRRYCRGGKKSPAPHRNKPVEAKAKLRSDDVDMGVDDRGTDIVFKKDGVRRFKAIQQFMKDHQFTDKEEDLLMDGLAAGDPGNLVVL